MRALSEFPQEKRFYLFVKKPMRVISYPNKQAFSRTIFLEGRKNSNNEDVKLQKTSDNCLLFLLKFRDMRRVFWSVKSCNSFIKSCIYSLNPKSEITDDDRVHSLKS
jgi:hypothetical protein